MNRALICRLLGWIALLIGAAMALSLPWAVPAFGQTQSFEVRSFVGLLGAMAACGLAGGLLTWFGRGSKGAALYRREAIAVVGLSWIMATILGALPFWFSGTCRGRDADGRPVLMDAFDGIFESASGFTGTGATVLTDLEDPELVPRAVLFWRSETHFLGGLGIMVLFVAILGLGSAGKALLLTEMPGPAAESEHARSQRAAWVFAAIFIGLTTVLTILLLVEGLTLFDALCHAFGTVATGGFSTYNKSIEHFQSVGVEMTIAFFMFAACTNFTLLYYVVILRPSKLLADVEFRTYAIIILVVTSLVVVFGLTYGDFSDFAGAVRYGLFQVVSIITNTGFGTADFDKWHSLSRGLLLVLMFVGGCAGSTSCSIKVIRYILLFKVFGLEMEQVFHPNVVRHVRIGGKPLADRDVRKDVAVYFGLILMIFLAGWLTLMAIEPDQSWVEAHLVPRDKLVDCASAVAATLNGVGPGLGIVGETQNYAHFHGPSKFMLSGMMLLGRLEVFVVLILFVPSFWRGKW
jgi:trk system potassium uptake protein TrkH